MTRHIIAALVLLAMPSLTLPAMSQTTKDITVDQAWLRATPNGAKVAGGYVTITNHGSTPDVLTGAGIPQAPKGEVHAMSMQNGLMHMQRMDTGLTVAPGKSVTLAPGGDHLMFMNPTASLKEGQSVAGTLTFEKAGTIPVTFAVGGMAAKTAPGSDHGAMAMPGMDMTDHGPR